MSNEERYSDRGNGSDEMSDGNKLNIPNSENDEYNMPSINSDNGERNEKDMSDTACATSFEDGLWAEWRQYSYLWKVEVFAPTFQRHSSSASSLAQKET
jgi:hypothetical protein